MPKPEKNEIEIGGRRFYAAASRSIANDFWIMSEAHRVGLANLHVEPGETPVDFARRVLNQAIEGGAVFTLMGGLLFPADMKPEEWTEKTAAETGAFLRSVVSEKDKEVIRSSVTAMLSNFFSHGLASATTSATSSAAIMEAMAGGGPAALHDLLTRSAPSGEA